MKITGLTFDSVIGLIEQLKKTTFSEPISNFETCNHKKLESSLKTPFQRPFKENTLEDFIEKGALLFFLLTQNHCFDNSNKRIAVGCLVTFSNINGYNLGINEISLYGLSMVITYLSKYGLKKEAITEIENMIRENVELKPGKKLSKKILKQMNNEFENFLINK